MQPGNNFFCSVVSTTVLFLSNIFNKFYFNSCYQTVITVIFSTILLTVVQSAVGVLVDPQLVHFYGHVDEVVVGLRHQLGLLPVLAPDVDAVVSQDHCVGCWISLKVIQDRLN
jgi:hypothetical protein